MINDIAAAAAAIVDKAKAQSRVLVSELSADYDHRNAAQLAFVEAMDKARGLRAEADEIEGAALAALNTALTNSGSVTLSLVQQLGEGHIVTSPAVPARKPKLVPAERKGMPKEKSYVEISYVSPTTGEKVFSGPLSRSEAAQYWGAMSDPLRTSAIITDLTNVDKTKPAGQR